MVLKCMLKVLFSVNSDNNQAKYNNFNQLKKVTSLKETLPLPGVNSLQLSTLPFPTLFLNVITFLLSYARLESVWLLFGYEIKPF